MQRVRTCPLILSLFLAVSLPAQDTFQYEEEELAIATIPVVGLGQNFHALSSRFQW